MLRNCYLNKKHKKFVLQNLFIKKLSYKFNNIIELVYEILYS